MSATRKYFTGWTFLAFLLLLLLLLPLLIITIWAWTGHSTSGIDLKELAFNSGLLAILVLCGTFATGALSAWLVAFFDFPGRKLFEWMLVLPLSIPAYLMSFAYTDFLGYSGWWYQVTGAAPDIRNIQGAALIFTLSLFPYVYLPLKAYFRKQGASLTEAGASLGHTPLSIFLRVLLPVGRPVIAGGLFLVLMEVLNDYGVVKYFGVPTFTVGIFRTWFSLGDIYGAMRLASILLLLVILLFIAEQRSRRNKIFSAKKPKGITLYRAGFMWRMLSSAWCGLLVTLAFVIPVAQMFRGAAQTWERVWDESFYPAVLHSLQLAFITATLAVIVAFFLVFVTRMYRHSRIYNQIPAIGSLGYAIPGAVIAMGVLFPSVLIDRVLYARGFTSGLFLTGAIPVLLYALLIRFLAVALQSFQSGYAAVPYSLNDAALNLGSRPLWNLVRIDLPLLRSFLASGFILVFVDVLKELPLSMLLRPFNYDTLATRAFSLASDELLREAANPSLMIVLAGLAALLLLNRFTR